MLSIIVEFLIGENQLYTLIGKAEFGANDEKKLSDMAEYADLYGSEGSGAEGDYIPRYN